MVRYRRLSIWQKPCRKEAGPDCRLYRHQKPGIKVVLIAGPSFSRQDDLLQAPDDAAACRGSPAGTHFPGRLFLYIAKITPRNPDGSYDFESLRAIDVPLFNQQIDDLSHGQREVHLSRFDFVTGQRHFDEKPTSLETNQPIVVEGLHALNDS